MSLLSAELCSSWEKRVVAAFNWILLLVFLLLSVVTMAVIVVWWSVGVWLFVVGVVSVTCVLGGDGFCGRMV